MLIEALACGTPVLAYRRGSIPEIIDDHSTGFVCEGFDDMTAVIQHISTIDRRQCRRSFEQRFSVERMTQDYLQVYERALGRSGDTEGECFGTSPLLSAYVEETSNERTRTRCDVDSNPFTNVASA